MSKLEVLTVAEVADVLRVHPTTIYRLMKRGDLPAFKIGENWRISSDALELWLSERSREHLPVFKTGN
jgi:excisionase family DNA binding protein